MLDFNTRLVFGKLNENYDLWSSKDGYNDVIEDRILLYNYNNSLKNYKKLSDFDYTIDQLKEVFFEKE